MTLVNRLIKEAKSKPDHLTIKPNQVRQIAAHCHSLRMTSVGPTIEELEQMICDGRFRMCGIPVKVDAPHPDPG